MHRITPEYMRTVEEKIWYHHKCFLRLFSSCSCTYEQITAIFRPCITAPFRDLLWQTLAWGCAHVCARVCVCVHTTRLWEPSSVDLILHHICPVEQAAIKVEVQGDGVSQPRHQQAVVPLMKVYPSYLVSDWENYERLKGILTRRETATKIWLSF